MEYKATIRRQKGELDCTANIKYIDRDTYVDDLVIHICEQNLRV